MVPSTFFYFQKNEAITVQQIQQIWPNPRLHSIAFPLEVPTTKVITAYNERMYTN